MVIFYSPEYVGHAYQKMDPNQVLMDTEILDTADLVRFLELRLGLAEVEYSPAERLVNYHNLLKKYFDASPGSSFKDNFETSFKNGSLSTANTILGWRDQLVMAGWDKQSGTTARFQLLSEVEKGFNMPSLGDRLWRAVDALGKTPHSLNGCSMKLDVKFSLLPPPVQKLIEAMKAKGLSVEEPTETSGSLDNDLSKAYTILTSDYDSPITLSGDGSLTLLEFENAYEMNEYAVREEANRDVWITGNGKSPDNWLRMMGKPTMGLKSQGLGLGSQLFMLAVRLSLPRLDIKSLIEWLTSPENPLGSPGFRTELANTIASSCGFRNKKCSDLLEKYVNCDCHYTDNSEGSEEEKAKKKTAESVRRKNNIDIYLPQITAPANTTDVDIPRLKILMNNMSTWASQHAAIMLKNPQRAEWGGQLAETASLCKALLALVGSLTAISADDLVTIASQLYSPTTSQNALPKTGVAVALSSPGLLISPSTNKPDILWLDFCGYNDVPYDCSFLYETELPQAPFRWQPENESAFRNAMQLKPFVLAKKLTLATAKRHNGEDALKHPLMIRLEEYGEATKDDNEKKITIDLTPIIKTPTTPTKTSPVTKIRFDEKPDQLQINMEKRQFNWPDHTSPTIMGTLIEHPYDYMLESLLGIKPAPFAELKDVRQTMGKVAHKVIEKMFIPGKPIGDVRSDIDSPLYGSTLDSAVEETGAILLQDENHSELERLREQLHPCLIKLADFIKNNYLTVDGCEVHDGACLGLNLSGYDLSGKKCDTSGYMDMRLKDENDKYVILDFKWTTSSYYGDLIKNDRSIQLETYRQFCGGVARVAYFILPGGDIFTADSFTNVTPTTVSSAGAKLIDLIKNSFNYRKEQLDSGTVETGLNLDNLDYYKKTAAKGLLPLKEGSKGIKKDNMFAKCTHIKFQG